MRQVNPDGSQLLLLNGGRYHVEIAADSSESTTRYYSIAGQRPATPLSPTEPARARAQQRRQHQLPAGRPPRFRFHGGGCFRPDYQPIALLAIWRTALGRWRFTHRLHLHRSTIIERHWPDGLQCTLLRPHAEQVYLAG